MYRACNQWEDAYRCARVHAGDTAEKQLAFLWARSLGGESALKLLNRLGHLNDVIDIAAQNGAFDFAFELARGAGAGSQVRFCMLPLIGRLLYYLNLIMQVKYCPPILQMRIFFFFDQLSSKSHHFK